MAAIKFGPHLKELRLHLCQSSSASQGVRKFVEEFYVPIKQANPKLPILIRECSGISPVVYARYEHGREQAVPLDNRSSKDVLSVLKGLA